MTTDIADPCPTFAPRNPVSSPSLCRQENYGSLREMISIRSSTQPASFPILLKASSRGLPSIDVPRNGFRSLNDSAVELAGVTNFASSKIHAGGFFDRY